MKIRQCFLKLQRKMSGMFFLRHTVESRQQCACITNQQFLHHTDLNRCTQNQGQEIQLSPAQKQQLNYYTSIKFLDACDQFERLKLHRVLELLERKQSWKKFELYFWSWHFYRRCFLPAVNFHHWQVILLQQPWKVFRIGTVCYNWPMSAHASQAFSIAHCTDSEDLPQPCTELAV